MFHVVFCILLLLIYNVYVSGSGSITSVVEERANLSAIVYFKLCGFCSERFPLPLGALDELRYFIVALPEPSIQLFNKIIRCEYRLEPPKRGGLCDFGVGVSETFHLTCVHIIFSSVSVAEWPPIGK